MLLRFVTFLFFIKCCICDERLPLFNDNDLIGFIKLKDNGDTVNIDFDVKRNGLKFIILDGVIPFSNNINHCKDFQNSSNVLKSESILSKFDTPKEDIIGNTIVITKDGQSIACSTVILDKSPLYEVAVSNNKLNGIIYLFDVKNVIKMFPLLSKSDEEKQLFIELVDDCSKTSNQNYTLNSFTAITTETIINSTIVHTLQNSYLKLFKDTELIFCKQILPANYLSANGMNVNVEQKNAFVAPRVTKKISKNVAIGETCNKTMDKVIIHNDYAPKLILFGNDSKIFKALSIDGECGILLPKFGFPILTTSLFHPVIGKIHLIKTSKEYFVVSDFQSIFDVNETPATLHFSTTPTLSSSCFNFSSSYTVKNSIPIRGFSTKNSKNNIQSFSRFIEFDNIKSVQVDLGWIKACANLTLLPLGVIKGNAILRTHNIAASRHLADIEIFEYPLFNETEIIGFRSGGEPKNNVKNLYFYKRPIDMTISTAPPCSESTFGAKTKLGWENELIEKLGSNKSERLFLKNKALTGNRSIIGLTIMADFDENVVGCGTIELKGQKKIAMAIFNDTNITGFIKLTQISSFLALPTEVSYYLEGEEHDESLQSSDHESPTKLFWEIVAMNGGICQTARPFDPFKVQDHNKCHEDIDFCPVGQIVNRSELLTQNSKKHFILHGFSIVDGAAASNLYVRLQKPEENKTICSKINLYEQFYIHWILESNSSLVFLKEKFSQQLSLSPYQIGVDYTRAFKGNRCSIFTVMLLLTPEEKNELKKKFDITNQKFFDEKTINCSSDDDDETLSSNGSHTFPTIFYHVFSILLYYFYTHFFRV